MAAANSGSAFAFGGGGASAARTPISPETTKTNHSRNTRGESMAATLRTQAIRSIRGRSPSIRVREYSRRYHRQHLRHGVARLNHARLHDLRVEAAEPEQFSGG